MRIFAMRRYILLFELLLLCGIRIASAQAISIGVKAGVPFTDAMIQSNDESRPYIVGPSLEVRLPAGFAIEADALYRRIGSSQSAHFAVINGDIGPFFSSFSNRVRGNSWEFPVI